MIYFNYKPSALKIYNIVTLESWQAGYLMLLGKDQNSLAKPFNFEYLWKYANTYTEWNVQWKIPFYISCANNYFTLSHHNGELHNVNCAVPMTDVRRKELHHSVHVAGGVRAEMLQNREDTPVLRHVLHPGCHVLPCVVIVVGLTGQIDCNSPPLVNVLWKTIIRDNKSEIQKKKLYFCFFEIITHIYLSEGPPSS